jgi:hypothetical protein
VDLYGDLHRVRQAIKAFEKDMRERLEREWSGLPTEKPAAQ